MNITITYGVPLINAGFSRRWLCLLLGLAFGGFCLSSNGQGTVSTSLQSKEPLFTLLPPDSTGIYFRNFMIEDPKALPYFNVQHGSGVAAGDLNNDGLCDLVFISVQDGPRIYRNKGQMKFDDVTANSGLEGYAGWFLGVTLVDINHDGWLDIYVCRTQPDTTISSNLLFINNHDGTFTEEAKKYGLQNFRACSQAYFFDYDNDGDLDVYIVNHPLFPLTSNTNDIYAYTDTALFELGKNRLMENIGDTFIDVSDKAGINPQLSFGLSASVTDINNDGYPDLYVANDNMSPDHFYINNGDKTFTEKTSEYFRETSHSSMGTDFGDLNNDGYQDLFVTDMMWGTHKQMKTHFSFLPFEFYKQLHRVLPPAQFSKNTLQLSNDGKFFSQISFITGTANTNWSWNVNIDDLNNDGWNDIFITQGMKHDYQDQDYMQLQADREHKKGYRPNDPDSLILSLTSEKFTNRLFINNGDLNFTDESLISGLSEKVFSCGAITADLNNDGNLDLVVNVSDDYALIYRNNIHLDTSKHYLRVKFEGDNLNRFGIGNLVNIYTSKGMQHKQLANSRGYQSCPEQILHFGLDTVTRVDSLIVKWYDRSTQTLYNVAANQVLTLKKKDAKKGPAPIPPPQPLMTEVHPSGLSGIKHQEDDFTDFKKDRLLPFMLSREGPAIAVGDINNDGLQDVFMGGACKGSKGQLLVQQKDGSFLPLQSQPWQNLDIETTGAVFADFNGDGYLDLYLANGSNEYNKNDTLLRDRLYLNQGGKGFIDASYMLPAMEGAKTSPVAFDFNGDGKMDLFIPGRMIPGEYPSGSRSYLLRNDGTHFTDVTEKVCPELAKTGNVTGAYSADLNGDGKPDLVVVSEWEPIKFFRNTGKALKRALTGSALDTLKGWWKCIAAADLNGDGKLDFLVGNQGMNSYLKATPKEPVTLYYNDFDGNGVKEPLVLHYLNGQADLLYDRATLCDQMPKFRKKFLTFDAYAKTGLSTVLTDEKIKTSEKFEANYFKSIWLENKGNFHFVIHELPEEVQWAPANSFLVTDLNGDNKPDVIIGENSESDIYWAGLSCASPGVVLINQGNNIFSSVDINKSGFLNPYVCRCLRALSINTYRSKCMLAANNNNELRVFQLPK